jgi:hypothetical protein
MNKKQDSHRYNLEYPSHLRPRTRLWITQEGDLMFRNGKTYRVKQIVRPLIKGSKPQIVLEQVSISLEDNSTLPL